MNWSLDACFLSWFVKWILKHFFLIKGLKVVFFFFLLVCKCVWCISKGAQIRNFPVVNYFTVKGSDFLSAGWPKQQLPPLLVERETVAKSLLLDRPRYDLISSGTALLWINLFRWKRKREIKSWHLKSCYWDSRPSESIARYCTTSHSILAHSSMGHLRISTNKAKWL